MAVAKMFCPSREGENQVRLVTLWLLTLLFVSPVTAESQTRIKDISDIFAGGKISATEYKNDYFGLTLIPTNAQFTQGGFVSANGKRARLIDAEANTMKYEDRYEIAILADALSANPLIRSAAQYVRSVRHEFEKEGMETVQEETPIDISGLHFVEATMKVTEQGRTHYRGMYTTFLNGYILSIDVTAASQERMKQIVLDTVHFKPADR
jgi:hypothetical protein